ncbi:hypothetical protein RCG23_02125 [Neobacillus sp. PS3-34]|uniref:hypothetical protein n=1 Tax=Neobacillus sp. PS3-34 TaxID=3070678 RepID=UPI0027E13C02|nr:hypothetical protein [Neobacillus sp. PS3-34]WML48937.1 hypothetical protein RCG23_02125 [Neobacillus sp. PS3-34]
MQIQPNGELIQKHLMNDDQFYLGYSDGFLDINTLSYRGFGAVWTRKNNVNYIIGYLFTDNPQDFREYLKDGHFLNTNEVDCKSLSLIYDTIRLEQEKKNWNTRKRLPILTVFRHPWRSFPPGWYIYRSREHYPFIASVLHRTLCTFTIEHCRVCENNEDIIKFINQTNQEHSIDIKMNFYDTFI